MLVAVVGGKLQGIEAAYLARKAGWHVRVVDKTPRVPASGLGDEFVQVDVTVADRPGGILDDVDLIIPALEDDRALVSLTHWSRKTGVPLAFDPQAYAVSSSKPRSTELFRKIGLPVPLAWPHCSYPVLAKPGRGSGSKGVQVFHDSDALEKKFSPQFPPPDWVLEEYVDGSQHSLEVIGRPGSYRALQVTDLYVDRQLDCKRVIAPSMLSRNLTAEFERLSLSIAEALALKGVMDVEVIFSRGEFKVLEIDARLPSQTPTAVYWSTDQNMVELLGCLYIKAQNGGHAAGEVLRAAVYEHVHASRDVLQISGERVMAAGGPLSLQQDFFGADEAITDFGSGRKQWVATLIYSGPDRRRAMENRNRGIAEMVRKLGIRTVVDPQLHVTSENIGSSEQEYIVD